jgi:cobalt/nickel transport system permease protein
MCEFDPKLVRKKSSGIVEKTIIGIVSLLKETIASETIAAKPGFLQKCDPRFKVAGVAVLLISVIMTRSVSTLALLYVVTIVFALLSRIHAGFFLKRTLFFIPLFSLFIVLPALFNFVTPGKELAGWTIFSRHVAITEQGVDSAVIFFMRVLASVSLSILLVLTTRQHLLLKTLRVFRVPKLFVMTIGMAYRYVFLFLDLIEKTLTAIKARVGVVASVKTGRRIATVNMAGLWLHSYRLQSQVYDAMLARGYTGEPHSLEAFRARGTDYAVLALTFVFLAGTLWLNRFIH